MKMQVRAILILIATLATMGLAGCGHYNCQSGATFGSSTCSSSGSGLGGGGGNGNAADAFVFVTNGSAVPGSVVGYTLDTATAPPTMVTTPSFTAPATPPSDAGLGMAVAQKQFLFTAFGSTDQIFGWSISTAGILTPVPGSPYSAPLATFASTTFDVHRVITDPAGTLLFVADEFQNQIFVYQIGSGGVLTAVIGSPFRVPFSPGYMTTDGAGKYLYFTDSFSDHTGSQVAAYSIGPTGNSAGVLTAVSGSPFPFLMWEVQGEPTGQFLIGTKGLSVPVNGADDKNLYVFKITQSGTSAGAITLVAPFPTTNSPFTIAVQTNTTGNLVDSFGLDDTGSVFNPVEGFVLNSSGTLAVENGSPFSVAAVGDRGQFDQSGNLLFVYGGVVVNNTVAFTVTSFDVTNSSLSTPTSIGTFGGFWVATDAP